MLIQIQPPQVSTLTWPSPVRSSVSAPCQSSLWGMCVFVALQVEPPAVVAADELVSRAAGVLGSLGCIDQSAAAMRAHVVVGADLVWRRAHDQDRIVEDVVGEIIADLGDVLEPAGLLPHLAPQLVALGPGIVLGDIGLQRVDHRVRQVLSRFDNPDRITHRILPLCDWQTRRCPCATPLVAVRIGQHVRTVKLACFFDPGNIFAYFSHRLTFLSGQI